MEQTSRIREEVVKKVQECLKELGFEAEYKLAEHEGIVYARREIQGKCLRVVTHITDREPKSAAGGSVHPEAARVRRAQAAIRPTLSAQTAARLVAEQETPKKDCK